MGLKFEVKYRKLEFLFEAGTSRGVLNHKKTWYIKAFDDANMETYGIGEAGPLAGLSIDDCPDFETKLHFELGKIENSPLPNDSESVFELAGKISDELPSVRFGIESALLDLLYGGTRKYFENEFYDSNKPININGLVWMGSIELMEKRLDAKINNGFSCIKIKIGAIEFEKEMQLLTKVRERYSSDELELRVDANGAFKYEYAKQVLKRLKELGVHSIEQPIKAGQPGLMAKLCNETPVDIALDEELIGVRSYNQKEELLSNIRPQYLILKPSLLGGFSKTMEWIKIAESMHIGWWITSALESNIGLNAICQFASFLDVNMPQGLGTGSLYQNNVNSPLEVIADKIWYNPEKDWEL
jgi:o-succinylbenzoate synthase